MSLRIRTAISRITDPQAMRALAHPVRLPALSYLQKERTGHRTQLSVMSALPVVTSWHLRHLESFGLVSDTPPRTAAPTSGSAGGVGGSGFGSGCPRRRKAPKAGRMLRPK